MRINLRRLSLITIFSLAAFVLSSSAVFGETKEECFARCVNEFQQCVATGGNFGDCTIGRDLCEGFCQRLAPGKPPGGLTGAAARLGRVGTGVFEGQPATLETVIGGIIQGALVLVGVIFLGLTVYGGYLWMLAREDEAQAKKAMQIIKMAVIGLAVVLGAYAITYFVVARLTGAAAG